MPIQRPDKGEGVGPSLGEVDGECDWVRAQFPREPDSAGAVSISPLDVESRLAAVGSGIATSSWMKRGFATPDLITACGNLLEPYISVDAGRHSVGYPLRE